MIRRLARSLMERLLDVVEREDRRRHSLVGQARLWRMKREFQIRFLREHGLQPEDRFLDLGCGTLRGGIPVIRYLEPGHYWGVEVRGEVLEEARAELERNELTERDPHLIHAPDLAGLGLETRFHVVWAYSVLIHMTDAILDTSLGFVARHLEDRGRMWANVNIGEGTISDWQGFPVVARPVEFYRTVAARHGLAVEPLGALEELGHRSGLPRHDRQVMLEMRPVGSGRAP